MLDVTKTVSAMRMPRSRQSLESAVANDDVVGAAEHKHVAGPQAKGLLLRWAWAASLEPEGVDAAMAAGVGGSAAMRCIGARCECNATQVNLGGEEIHNMYVSSRP
jgi:hypothetical protein